MSVLFFDSVLPSQTNESPMKNQVNSRSDLISTPDSNKNYFYNSCNSIEILFDNDDHHMFINLKYFNINELNALQTKQIYFGILHLNIAFLR